MKKILFLGCNFFEYEKEIIKLLKSVMKFEVIYLAFSDYEYKYKNIFDRIINAIYYKIFLKRNKKHIMFNKKIISTIEKNGKFDLCLTIRADKFSEEIFKFLKTKDIPMYLHHWDSFSFISGQEKYLKYFDFLSSFDKKEARDYGMKFIPNFYLKEKMKKNYNTDKKYDFFTVMKYDSRFEILEKLAKYLKSNGIKYKFIVVTDQNIKSDYIEITEQPISLDENYNYLSESSGIVEIGHTKKCNLPYQGGATFRIADAIGFKKKIITNYNFIKEYDIYCDKNIAIIDENNIELDKDFLESNYEEYESDIYNSYSDTEWIKKIFIR